MANKYAGTQTEKNLMAAFSGEQFEALMEGRELGEISQTSLFDGFEETEE